MIKWGCIQPLTGGFVFGAREALKCPPSWIISYPGLTSIKYDKDNNPTSVGNEVGLLKWMKDHNELPSYQVFNKHPFEESNNFDVELIDDPLWTTNKVDYSNTDIVISVPVCSGLSQATIASQESKDKRNVNMLWNAEFALKKIHPKVYIFENAPALFSKAGESVRNSLNALGEKYGYSLVYYKTDTKLHDNCQRRPRTFVFFIQYRDADIGAPTLFYENIQTNVKDYLSRIPSTATQQVSLELSDVNKLFLEYIKHKFGKDYRLHLGKSLFNDNFDNTACNEFCEYISKSNYSDETKNTLTHLIKHINNKVSSGKNFYSMFVKNSDPDSTVRAVMFKTIPTQLHYSEDRLYTIRELLHLMGMPHDYELQGNIKDNCDKIGQNVPARTAEFIVLEAQRIVNNWNTINRNNSKILFIDNTNQSIKQGI